MTFKNNPGCGCCGRCGACTMATLPDTWDVVLPEFTDIPGGWGLTSECGAGDCAAGGVGGTYNLARVDNINGNCVWRTLFTNPYTCIPGTYLGIQLTLSFNENGINPVLGQLDFDIAFCDSWPYVQYEGGTNLDTDVYAFKREPFGPPPVIALLRAGWDYTGIVDVFGSTMSIQDDYNLIAGTTGVEDSSVRNCDVGSETTFNLYTDIVFSRYWDDGTMFGAREFYCAWPGQEDAAGTHQFQIEPV